MTSIKRAAIYARISRDSELIGEGVERQERDCRDLADRLGYQVAAVFVDNDVSASTSSRKERPKYDAMVRAVRAGQIDVVLAYSNSRLTRRPRELEDLIELHAKTAVQIRTVVSGDDDLSTADGRMVARIKANVDAAEAERTAERVRRALADRAERGFYTGPRPFGYQFAADASGRVLIGRARRLVIDSAEAAVIRECVRRVLNDEGLWSIMNDLNRRGIPTSTGGQWRSQPLRRMLLRWTHAGYRKHQERKDGKWTGPIRLYKGDWEPIIDEETHKRVIAKLTDPSRTSNRGDTELKYLLTWMAFCGVCDGRLVGTLAQGLDLDEPGKRSADSDGEIWARTDIRHLYLPDDVHIGQVECLSDGPQESVERRAELFLGIAQNDVLSQLHSVDQHQAHGAVRTGWSCPHVIGWGGCAPTTTNRVGRVSPLKGAVTYAR